MVSAKRTRSLPGISGTASREISAALDTAKRSPSTTRPTAKTALWAGSSQHGKARRASVASNWVVAITCSAPSASVKVDR